MIRHPVWSSAFRPFFLAAAAYGPLLLALWVGAHLGWWGWPEAALPLPLLHGHELLFGFAAALVCGVLLTAMPGWSGADEVHGRPLAALVLLWFAGRVAVHAGGWLPWWLALVLDCALLPALAGLLYRSVARARRRLFWLSLPPLAAFAAANLLFHLAAARGAPTDARWALLLGVHALVFLFALYGGLFIPAFTRRWLQERGEPAAAIQMPLEYATAIAMLAFAVADLGAAPARWMVAAALAAAGLHAWRQLRWRGWRTGSEPLLWSIHLGYAWLIAALLLRALAEVVPAVPREAWIHVFTVGAYGMLKIGLMTRVALRHTGRPLRASPAMQVAFALMFAAALLRLLYAVQAPSAGLLTATAVLWAGAFLLYLAVHGPMLLRPSLPRG